MGWLWTWDSGIVLGDMKEYEKNEKTACKLSVGACSLRLVVVDFGGFHLSLLQDPDSMEYFGVGPGSMDICDIL